jgi:hypothetical protein
VPVFGRLLRSFLVSHGLEAGRTLLRRNVIEKEVASAVHLRGN